MAKQDNTENKFDFKIGDVIRPAKGWGYPNLKYEIVERKSQEGAGYSGQIGNVYGVIPFATDFWGRLNYVKEYMFTKATKKEKEETLAHVIRQEGKDGLLKIESDNKIRVKLILSGKSLDGLNSIQANEKPINSMKHSIDKNQDNFKFSVGQSVKYIGDDPKMRNKEYTIQSREVNKRMFKKDENIYSLTQRNKPYLLIKVTEQVLKGIVANPEGKKFITKIDERAKQIQKASGVLKTERVTFYNISRSKAKEQAFQELKK